MSSSIRDDRGFSIIEMMVALVILTVGLLSMAATTGYVATQVRAGDLRTERAAAMQEVIEGLRATPFANLQTRPEANDTTIGDFQFWWTVNTNGNLAQVEIYSRPTTGRGRLPGASSHGVLAQDTFFFSIARR